MFKLKKHEFAMQTNIDIPVSADNMNFDAMCRKAAEKHPSAQ